MIKSQLFKRPNIYSFFLNNVTMWILREIYINQKKSNLNLHGSSLHKVSPQRANLYLQRSYVNPQRSKCPVWWDAENNHSQVQWSNAPRISQSWVSSTHINIYLCFDRNDEMGLFVFLEAIRPVCQKKRFSTTCHWRMVGSSTSRRPALTARKPRRISFLLC